MNLQLLSAALISYGLIRTEHNLDKAVLKNNNPNAHDGNDKYESDYMALIIFFSGWLIFLHKIGYIWLIIPIMASIA